VDGITFDPATFISSPYFWRAMLLLAMMWALKNARTIFDELHYIWDKFSEVFRKPNRAEDVDQVVVEAMRRRFEDGEKFDAGFIIELQNRMIGEKDGRIAELEEKLHTTDMRVQAMVNLAIEKSEESAQVVRLLNGTVEMFNTVAEKLTTAIERLCQAVEEGNGGDHHGT